MDFYEIKERTTKKGVIEVYADFKVCRSEDLMVRGKGFYAIWDEEKKLWSKDEYDVQRLVDEDLARYAKKIKGRTMDNVYVRYLGNFSSNAWSEFRKYMNNISDNAKELDHDLTFANEEVKKGDYVSKKLPYPIKKGTITGYDKLMGVLYDPEERDKLEWAIGSIISGDSKYIQKFLVLYGEAGAGKSTILNIIQELFEGYYTMFNAKALTTSSNSFSTEMFKNNPLVAIQHDGDLSRIEDNTILNSIVSHEEMTINEKFKPSYTSKINSFLFMGTNKPVKITDAKSGIIRRLIDVKPSGNKLPIQEYRDIMATIKFELGAIAQHCLDVYNEMGMHYYDSYRPIEMMFTTDIFFNFVESNYHTFKEQDGVTLAQAYQMYKTYCDEALIEYKLARHKFREELKSYFSEFTEMKRVDGTQTRNYYSGFLTDKFKNKEKVTHEELSQTLIEFTETESVIDKMYPEQKAQLANNSGVPSYKWKNVKTKLKEIDTTELHYLKLPINHIVIDFDIKNENGDKDLDLNIRAASKWPPTYAELSKSGQGVHLHYLYEGDAEKLTRIFDEDIEIKVFVGDSSLRRKLSKCNTLDVTSISSGLPLKKENKSMINFQSVQSELGLRKLIERNLKKEIHAGTKPSVDFIHKVLEDAYDEGLEYDLTDMRPKVLAFANNSSNQAEYCLKLVSNMKFKSEDKEKTTDDNYESDKLAFFDVEVFPNLFMIVWKLQGKDPVVMINPEPKELEDLLKLKLVGFNCRRYDNHIIYARYIGYTIEQLYTLSQKIVGGSRNAMFREAYNLSYTDIYDFSSKKQSLKKFQIELGIHHLEMELPWDEPVDKKLWPKVAEYCINDVVSTEAVFEARKADFTARRILADLSGLTVNDTTQRHTAKIIFGDDPRPQDKFIYTDLSEMFPGYKFDFGKSSYRGEDPKEGGYVYAETGMYTDVAVLDVVSMHPNSLLNMDMFGPYTRNYRELIEARVAIKNGRYDDARGMLNGIMTPYLKDDNDSEALSYALKIVINIVYGLTSAKFENKFKDPRNIDNIVAKRGALFMIDLKHEVQERGYTVAHIKTDSIKIPNADKEIIDFVVEFGKKYGYEFDHEETYKKMCLVNDAVFIAQKSDDKWDAVGAQFAYPYVFKTLFSGEKVEFWDLAETKSVTTALYLDMNEDLPEGEHNRIFIGKAGSFVPILPGKGGGELQRIKEDKYYSASGAKGYRWLEAAHVKEMGREDDIDMSYYNNLVDVAMTTINKFGDAEWFVKQ